MSMGSTEGRENEIRRLQRELENERALRDREVSIKHLLEREISKLNNYLGFALLVIVILIGIIWN